VSSSIHSACFSPQGELNIETISHHTDALYAYAKQTSDLCLDLSRINHCDTAGLQILYSLKCYCIEHQKSLSIQSVSEEIQHFFDFFSISIADFNVSKDQ
jgi:phospholipid transport system transporter-binding protein